MRQIKNTRPSTELALIPLVTAEVATSRTVTMIVDPFTAIEEDFLEFWKAYPRKVDKKRALASYRQARRSADAQTILAGARRYTAVVREDGRASQHMKHPTTWLNGDCWEDEEEPILAATNGELARRRRDQRTTEATARAIELHETLARQRAAESPPPPPPPREAEPLPMPRRQPDVAFDSLWSAQTGVTLEQLQEARTQATHVMHYVTLVTDLLDQQKRNTQ